MLFETMYNYLGMSTFPLIWLAISAIMALHYLIEVPPMPFADAIIETMDKESKDEEEFSKRLLTFSKEVSTYYTKANFWIITGKICMILIVVINFVEVCILGEA